MAEVKEKSGPKMALKNLTPLRSKGRDLDYWKARLVLHNPGDKDWSVRIQHAGKREWFTLETPNKTTAAARAKKRFEFVKAHGWEAAILHFKYGEEKAKVTAEKNALTVGEYIAEVESLATEQSPRTGSRLREMPSPHSLRNPQKRGHEADKGKGKRYSARTGH